MVDINNTLSYELSVFTIIKAREFERGNMYIPCILNSFGINMYRKVYAAV